MTEAQIALARRAVAAPGWRWVPGMRIAGTKFARVVAVRDDAPCGAEEGATCDDNAAMWLDEWTTPMLPDLSDPLTALGLLALVRERWGATANCMCGLDRWYVWTSTHFLVDAPTETEALIAALEVAP